MIKPILEVEIKTSSAKDKMNFSKIKGLEKNENLHAEITEKKQKEDYLNPLQ